jgi:ubiquitin
VVSSASAKSISEAQKMNDRLADLKRGAAAVKRSEEKDSHNDRGNIVLFMCTTFHFTC